MDSTRLFVGNVPFKLKTQEALKEFFETVLGSGSVIEVQLMQPIKDSHDSNTPVPPHRGFGFLTMASAELAAQAITEFNGKTLLDRPIKVDYAQARGGSNDRRRFKSNRGGYNNYRDERDDSY